MDQTDIIPVTTFLAGVDGRTVVLELDGIVGGVERGSVDLSPAQARALAADLEAMADEAES